MNSIDISGDAAEVRWGYHRAARLSQWRMGGDRTVTATVTESIPLRLAQRDLTFVVPRPKGPAWIYPILSLSCTGTAFTATLGLPEGV